MFTPTLKTKISRPVSKQMADNLGNPIADLVLAGQLGLVPPPVLVKKTDKSKLNLKKNKPEDEEAIAAALPEGSISTSASASEVGSADQSLIYALNERVTSDATESSSSPSDISGSDALNSDTTSTGTGLSTAQMVGLGILGLAAVGGVVAIAVSSGNSGGSTNNTAASPSSPTLGSQTAPTPFTVADGYIKGAQIYLQTPTGLQILEGIVTNTEGVFLLPANANPNNYPLVAVGGINTDTGLPQTVPLKAPVGATVINPLTTLIQDLLEEKPSLSLESAAVLIANSLGISLPAGKSLTNYDPLEHGDVETQKVAAEIATLMNQTSDGGTAILTNLANLIYSNHVAQVNTAIDLTDNATLIGLLQDTPDDVDVNDDRIADSSISFLTAFEQDLDSIRLQTTFSGIATSQKTAAIDELEAIDLISLSGGGWKALSANAGFMAGMLKYFDDGGSGTTLEQLWGDDIAISANSGSTWFLDLLAYDPNFEAALQYNGAGDSSYYGNLFDTSNYMGVMGTNYNSTFSAKSILDIVQGAPLSWADVVSKVVFGYSGTDALMKGVNFYNGVRGTNAIDTQTLLYYIGLSTNKAAINSDGSLVNWATVTDTSGGDLVNFLPVTITSLGSGSVSADALPTIASGDIKVTYGSTANTTTATRTIDDLNFNGLTAFQASAASSSAVAILNSLGIFQGAVGTDHWWDLLNLVENTTNQFVGFAKETAPLVLVESDGTASDASTPASNTTLTDMATASYLRLVDGGYIDNSSLTSGMAYLLNKLGPTGLDGFDITQIVYTVYGETSRTNASYHGNANYTGSLDMAKYAQIGDTALKLFTGSNQSQTQADISIAGLDIFSLDASHPSAELFDSSKTTGLDAPTWSWWRDRNNNGQFDDKDFKLAYYKLGVTTAAEANTWGVDDGLNGTLNLWVVTDPTKAAPIQSFGTWSEYSTLYSDIISALNADDGMGARLLAQTMGAEAAVLPV